MPLNETPNRVVVVDGKSMADMTAASTLRKASCPPLHDLPRAEAHMIALARFAMHSCCPYKGEASCFSISAGGSRFVDAVRSFEALHDRMSNIDGYPAFHPDRLDAIQERQP